MTTTNSFGVNAMLELMAPIEYGVVHWFDNKHGFGFVTPADSEFDLFVDFPEVDGAAGPHCTGASG